MIWNSQVDWHSSIAWLGPEMSRWQHVATEPKRHHLHHASLLQKLAFDFWSSSHFLSFLSLSQPGSFAFLDFHVPKACREREKIRVRWDLSSHDMISCETENAGKGWEIAIGIRMDMIWIWYGYDMDMIQIMLKKTKTMSLQDVWLKLQHLFNVFAQSSLWCWDFQLKAVHMRHMKRRHHRHHRHRTCRDQTSITGPDQQTQRWKMRSSLNCLNSFVTVWTVCNMAKLPNLKSK